MHTTITEGPPDFTPEQKLKLLAVITDEANTPQSADRIVSDVEALIIKTRDIREMFLKTTGALTTIDQTTGPDGKALNDTGSDFTPKWKGYSERFDALIATSTTAATNLGMACINFEDPLLPMLLDTTSPDRMSLEDKRKSVESFMEVTKAGAGDATKRKAEFTSLRTDLNTFAGTFADFVARRLHVLEEKISEYRGLIDQAKSEIDKLNDQITDWMVAIGVTIFAALVAAVLLPGFGAAIAGAALLAVIGEGGTIGYLASQKADWEDKKKDYENKIADLQTQVNAVHECQRSLGDSETKVPQICTAIASFEDIWQSVQGLCTSIWSQLSYADGELRLKNERMCKTYLEKSKTYLGPVGKALIKYGELQANANGGGFDAEKHAPVSYLHWGNSHPLLKMRVETVFKSYNFPITTV